MKGNTLQFVRRIKLLFLGLFMSYSLFAQVNVRVNFNTYNKGSFKRAELWVQQADSLVFFKLIDDLQTDVRLPNKGAYVFHFSAFNYKSFHKGYEIQGDTTINILLEDSTLELPEVIVTGKSRPKLTATGEIFKLSKKAKSSGNPFKALSEIPLLQVDISSQSIKMRSGETPLILIDGHLVNSGVQPIHPENIESVEVSEVVSARFLQMGITKIINIRLRKNIPLYSYIDLRTRHDIPLREGFGGANFEFGKKTFALSGHISVDYLTNDRVRNEIIEQIGQQKKELSGMSISKSGGIDGHLLAKWTPIPSDYFSAMFKVKRSRNRMEGTQEGSYVTPSQRSELNTSSNKTVLDGGLLACLFHEHTFGNQSTLTTFFKYNYGFYDLKQNYLETYEKNQQTALVDLATLRNQYNLSVDYDSGKQSYGLLAVGNDLQYTRDKVTNQGVTPFLTANVGLGSNYTHATYSNQWKWLYYMASIGVQGLAVKVADKNHAYWRPRAASSITLRLPHYQSLRGSYYMTNRLPESRNLITFNLSTNPWVKEEGNLYLVPMQIHQFDLNYNCPIGSNFQVRLWGNHNRYSQIIEPYIRQEGDYQIKSFRNNGTYRSTRGGVSVNYRVENFQISTTTDYRSEVFQGQDAKGSYGISGYFRWDFGDFFIYSSLLWRNISYTSISQTSYKNPTEAHIQIAWQANKRLYLSLGLPYFWGTRSHVTQIDQASYTSRQQLFYESASMRPWLLISWTLRKNPKLAIPRKIPNM